MKTARLLVIPLSLYGFACALPAYWDGDGTHPVPGIVCLTLVPWVMICLPWWANPPFFAGCIALATGRAGVAMVLGCLATALAVTFFLMAFAETTGIGSAVWLMSMASLAITAAIAWGPWAQVAARSGSECGRSPWDDL